MKSKRRSVVVILCTHSFQPRTLDRRNFRSTLLLLLVVRCCWAQFCNEFQCIFACCCCRRHFIHFRCIRGAYSFNKNSNGTTISAPYCCCHSRQLYNFECIQSCLLHTFAASYSFQFIQFFFYCVWCAFECIWKHEKQNKINVKA